MASYKKLAELVYKLHRLTAMGKIAWEQTVTRGVYQASFSDYSIQISLQWLNTAEEDVKIKIVGDDGDEIESFTDRDIEHDWLQEFSGGETDSSYDMMYDIYQTARRLALGTEQAINQILSTLNEAYEDDEVPF